MGKKLHHEATLIEEHFLEQRLSEHKANGLLREMPLVEGKIDFCSNDYLGFAKSKELQTRFLEKLEAILPQQLGATGSRLISGNHELIEALEARLASFHRAQAALLFNSGYQANVGLFSSIARAGDTMITDEYVHASIIDGVRLGKARRLIFKHNDLEDLEEKLRLATGNVFVGVEALNSMEGDQAPLQDIVKLCERYRARLIVDEAHSTGIYGNKGEGYCIALGIEKQVFARIHTFGKAMGSHGAAIVGSSELKAYLINFARTFIFTTGLPLSSIVAIDCAYDHLEKNPLLMEELATRSQYFCNKAETVSGWCISQNNGPIQYIRGGSVDVIKNLSHTLWGAGLWAKAIVPPTVPKGKEMIRIVLHSFTSFEEIDQLFSILSHPSL